MSKVAVWKETDFLKYKEQSYKKKKPRKIHKNESMEWSDER